MLRGKSSEVVVKNAKFYLPEEKLMAKFKDDGIYTKTLLPVDKKKNISIFTINYGNAEKQVLNIPNIPVHERMLI